MQTSRRCPLGPASIHYGNLCEVKYGAQTMSDKPSYLGLLNAIAVGEARGYELLAAWSKHAGSPDVAETLNFVAIREQEHAATFTKRLCELGFEVRDKPNDQFANNLALAKSNTDDREKFEEIFGYGRRSTAGNSAQDPLGKLFDDNSIDPQTGALLGRFIAEERDSGRRLRAAYDQLECLPTDNEILRNITERLDSLTNTLEELKDRELKKKAVKVKT